MKDRTANVEQRICFSAGNGSSWNVWRWILVFHPTLVQGETVDGRPLVVRHFRRADEIKTCHILFISQSEARHMDEIVSSLKGKPIFTVADADGPSSAGVIIRFIVENNKVHFRVNQEAAAPAGLTLSAKLLRIADAAPSGRAP
jgi:hypothetical protein